MEGIQSITKRAFPEFKGKKKWTSNMIVLKKEYYVEILLRDFGKNELLILFWIARFQFGFNRLKEAHLKVKYFAKYLGINKSAASTAIKRLEEHHIIIRNHETDALTLNLQIERWLTPYKKGVDLNDYQYLDFKHAQLQKEKMKQEEQQNVCEKTTNFNDTSFP
ncbi:replication protein [Patescibacteria group bacterium]|nr:replication protein [Patescibacteria group bacterium]